MSQIPIDKISKNTDGIDGLYMIVQINVKGTDLQK